LNFITTTSEFAYAYPKRCFSDFDGKDPDGHLVIFGIDGEQPLRGVRDLTPACAHGDAGNHASAFGGQIRVVRPVYERPIQAPRQFYEALFGWSFLQTRPVDKQNLTIAREGVPIAKAVSADRATIKDNPARWLSYMSVADVDQTVLRIEKNHGSVYMPPQPSTAPRPGRPTQLPSRR